MRPEVTVAVPRVWWHEPAVDALRRAGLDLVGYETLSEPGGAPARDWRGWLLGARRATGTHVGLH